MASSIVNLNDVFSLLAVVLTSCACMAMAQGGGNQPSCVQKLLPCQAYLHATTDPPAMCCLPLKELIDGDPHCLCTIFNNEKLLKSFNVTKDAALDLPKRCGATVHVDKCNNNTASTAPAPGSTVVNPPPPPPATPTPPAKEASSTTRAYGEKSIGGVVVVLMIGWTSISGLRF